MLNNRTIPLHLMPHTIYHYSRTFTKENGAEVATPVLTQTFKGFMQEQVSDIITEFMKREERTKQICYLVSETAFDLININDRITFKSKNWRIVGKSDMCDLQRVFSLDLQEEVL